MTTLHTIGHGNRSAEEFIDLLRRAGVRHLVDVRAFPASRRHPQFERGAIQQALSGAEIAYTWEGEALGGRRRSRPGSLNSALRNPAFRAYADHMMQPPFRSAMNRVIALAAKEPTAIMCAERLPWQCHRYLIADSALARDVSVWHIISPEKPKPHVLNPLVRLDDGVLIYDRGAQPELELEQGKAGGGNRRGGSPGR